MNLNALSNDWTVFAIFIMIKACVMKFIPLILLMSMAYNFSWAQTGCTSGDCLNGRGVYKYANGDEYHGDFKNGKRRGFGEYMYANGARYSGEWVDDYMEGSGTYLYGDGRRYIGQMRANIKTGQGKFSFSDGSLYEGGFLNDVIHGSGTYRYSNGDKYVGQFQNGKRNGYGTFYYNNGQVSAGNWVNDVFQGGEAPQNSNAAQNKWKPVYAKDYETGAEEWGCDNCFVLLKDLGDGTYQFNALVGQHYSLNVRLNNRIREELAAWDGYVESFRTVASSLEDTYNCTLEIEHYRGTGMKMSNGTPYNVIITVKGDLRNEVIYAWE
ncbi:MAG: hypothetical protein RL266_1000 [Bacteroidota bacterium]